MNFIANVLMGTVVGCVGMLLIMAYLYLDIGSSILIQILNNWR